MSLWVPFPSCYQHVLWIWDDCTLISAWISARWVKEGSIHTIYTWLCFIRMKTQRHFAVLPAISIKEAQQQDILIHWQHRGRSSGDKGQLVCTRMFVCEQAICRVWLVHCLLLSMECTIWLPRLTSIITMVNPSSWNKGHCRQMGGGQLSQWHCLICEGKHAFSPQISHQPYS